MESIKTNIIVETNDGKKARKYVDAMIKKGYTLESTNMSSNPIFPNARYRIELSKMEQFKL